MTMQAFHNATIHGPRRVSLLLLFLAVVGATLVHSKSLSLPPTLNLTRESKDVRDAVGHLASISTKGPLSAFLRNDKAAAESLTQLHEMIARMDAATSKQFNLKQPDPDLQSGAADADELETGLRHCHMNNFYWKNGLRVYHRARGLPLPDMQCVTVVTSRMLNLRSSDRAAYNAIRRHARDVDAAAAGAVAALRASDPAMTARLANWTLRDGARPFATLPSNFSLSAPGQTCTYDHVAFVRAARTWYAVVTLTNAPTRVVMPRFRRESLQELVSLGDGTTASSGGSARSVLARGPGNVWVNDTTTVLQTASGAAGGSTFAFQSAQENLAVAAALELTKHDVQEAHATTTASNIATLAFPLVLSALPAALFTDLNTFGMIVYTVATDVLTAVPLLIKAVELLHTGRRRSTAVHVRITGGNQPGPDEATDENGNFVFKAAEAWAAECRPNADLWSTGVVLLLVAVACSAFGIVGEIAASVYVRRRGKRGHRSSNFTPTVPDSPIGWIVVPDVKQRAKGGGTSATGSTFR